MAPSKGGRVLSLINVVPNAGSRIEVATETHRDEVAAFTAYGTSLPEAGIAFSSEILEGKRVSSWVPIDRDVYNDSAQLARVRRSAVAAGSCLSRVRASNSISEEHPA